MAPLTLVSCLFDLAEREGNPRRRAIAEYLRVGDLVTSAEADLVCFVDPGLEGEVARLRAAHGLADRTRVIPVELEDLPAHALLGDIAAAWERNPLRNAAPDKDTPLYVVLQWSKFALLRETMRLDPFGASHFAWVDYGLGIERHVRHAEDAVFDNPSDAVSLLCMRGFTEDDVRDRRSYYSHLRGLVAAGYFPGSRANQLWLCDRFDEQARTELDAGFAPYEEQLLPVLYTQDPDRFELRYGSFLLNELRVRSNFAFVL